jgi:hypothetical protein
VAIASCVAARGKNETNKSKQIVKAHVIGTWPSSKFDFFFTPCPCSQRLFLQQLLLVSFLILGITSVGFNFPGNDKKKTPIKKV